MLLTIVNHLILIIEKNNFLVSDVGPNLGINDSTGGVEKKILTLVKQIRKYCLSLHCNANESSLYVNKTEICKFKPKNK